MERHQGCGSAIGGGRRCRNRRMRDGTGRRGTCMRGTTFALVGCSHPHARWHLNTLRLMPEIDGVWVWDPDPAAADETAPEAGHLLRGVMGDLNALLHRDDVEFVLIAC